MTIYIIQGYEEQSRVDQTLTDVTQIEVFADNEAEAIQKAKSYVKKSHYRVSQVIQKEPQYSPSQVHKP